MLLYSIHTYTYIALTLTMINKDNRMNNIGEKKEKF